VKLLYGIILWIAGVALFFVLDRFLLPALRDRIDLYYCVPRDKRRPKNSLAVPDSVRNSATREATCRVCHDSALILVSDDKGTICIPCLRFQEAMDELEQLEKKS
jgi:hypothetical protein